MSARPRIGVIGAGLIGRRHAELVAEAGQLAAIVDPNPAAADLADRLGSHWFPEVAAGLAGADGAIVATPNQLHAEHALDCIARGLPVLIEKPVTDRTETGRALVDAAARAGVPVLVGHHRRHNPLIATAKAAIAGGRIGRLTVVNAQFWLYKPDDYFREDWRRQEGAGPVFINLIHDIDLLRHLCGEIVRVVARASHAVRGFDVEDSAAMLLEFEGGALGTVTVSDTTVAPWSWEFASGENPAYPKTETSCYQIGGTEGSLSVPDLTLWTQPGGRSWWKSIAAERLDFEPQDPLRRQIAHFSEVIAGRAAPLVSGADGLRTLAVVEAIAEAARTGGAVATGAG